MNTDKTYFRILHLSGPFKSNVSVSYMKTLRLEFHSEHASEYTQTPQLLILLILIYEHPKSGDVSKKCWMNEWNCCLLLFILEQFTLYLHCLLRNVNTNVQGKYCNGLPDDRRLGRKKPNQHRLR